MARKPPVKPLFKTTQRQATTIEELIALLSETSEERLLEDNLRVISEAADAAESGNIERGKEYAHKIRVDMSLLRHAIRTSNATEAALCAMRMTQWWMQLRADALLARPVRNQERMMKGKGFVRSKRPTRAAIDEAVKNSANKADAANKLGINVRTLRRWLNE